MLRILSLALCFWGACELLLWLGVAFQRRAHTLLQGIGVLLIGVSSLPGVLGEGWTQQVVLNAGWIALVWSSFLLRKFVTNILKNP